VIRILLTTFLLTIFGTTYSQKIAITYYDSAWLLTSKTFGRYYRIGFIDTTKYQYSGQVTDYYMNGKLQMKGKFIANSKVDTFYFYYPSGNLMMKGPYQNNTRYGVWTNYYENGGIKDKVFFNGDFICALEYYDEAGTSRMINGTGDWETEYYNDLVMGIINVKGHYKDTLRHGTWKFYKKSLIPGISHKQKLECIEEYDHGRFIKGKYYWGGGGVQDIGEPTINILPEARKFKKLEQWEASKYASIETYPYLKFLPNADSAIFFVDKLAAFPGGMNSLTGIFQENMKLCKSYIASQKLRSSTFYILISEEGELKITDDPYRELGHLHPDNQAFYGRVKKILKKLPTWTPAVRDGKKVKNYFMFSVYMDNGKISVQLLSLHEKRKV
jgi:hypothetical protein